MKTINVILGFHSHEPTWELEQTLLSHVGEEQNHSYYPVTNYFLQNFPEDRPLHDFLLEMAHGLDIPVWLDASNEIYEQLASHRPQAFERLQSGFQDGFVHAVLTHAHHVHTGLATPQEHHQEVSLNERFLFERMNLNLSETKGVFSPEASYRTEILDTYQSMGIDYLMFPNLHSRNTPYQVKEHKSDLTYSPYLVESPSGNQLIALPINTSISERVWLSLEAGGFDPLRTQAESVYEDQTAIEHYKSIIYEECEKAPDNGLLLYASDFEFMGLAYAALPLIHEAWHQILEENQYNFQFHSPAEYVQTLNTDDLSVITFDHISWAPAHTPVFRFDGFYPAINTPEAKIYEQYPFIFWQTGRIFSQMVNYLYDYYLTEHPVTQAIEAPRLPIHDIRSLSLEEQLRLHNLLLKRACNWGWMVPEDRGRWVFIHLREIINLISTLSPHPDKQIDEWGNEHLRVWRELLQFDLTRRIEHTYHAVEQTYLDTDVPTLNDSNVQPLFDRLSHARSLLYEILSTLDNQNPPSLSVLAEISLKLSFLLDDLTHIYDDSHPFLERLLGHKNGHIYYQKPQLPEFIDNMNSDLL